MGRPCWASRLLPRPDACLLAGYQDSHSPLRAPGEAGRGPETPPGGLLSDYGYLIIHLSQEETLA